MSQDVTHVEGFQKSNRKLNDQRICNQMVKMVPDWSECVAKRVAKWTGSTTGN